MVEFPEVVQLARPRSGHFDLGTGYHGDLWLDLDALLLRPALLRAPVRWLAERLREHSAVAACLEEVRGRGAVPVAVAALVSLGEASATVQARMRVPFYPASTVPSRAWPAEQCPLCAAGTPYTDPLSGDVATPLPGRRGGTMCGDSRGTISGGVCCAEKPGFRY